MSESKSNNVKIEKIYNDNKCNVMVHRKAMRMIETLGSRLRQLRISKHLKQEQVAALIDVNKSSICTYENNMRQPSLDILVRLATLYRVSTDYLLGCQSNKTIDVSGLTTVEMNMVANLVENMTEKNKKINNLDKD